jgi:hypothetical protein
MEMIFEMHLNYLKSLPDIRFSRFLLDTIDWTENSILITGLRGVGKTVLVHQYFMSRAQYQPVKDYLYVLADSLPVAQKGLYNLVHDYFTNYGGKAVFIDELQKYDNWQVEWKTILDVFKHKKIVVSGSSSLLLNETDSDLKRRRAAYVLPVLTFREYLNLTTASVFTPIGYDEILSAPLAHCLAIEAAIANNRQIDNPAILRLFKEYLRRGQFAFCQETKSTYATRLAETINAVIEQDICKLFSLSGAAADVLKKLFAICVTADPFTPNYVNLAREIGLAKDTVKKYFQYLEKAGLIHIIRPRVSKTSDIVTDKGKVLASNSNYLFAANFQPKTGTVREVAFISSTIDLQPTLHQSADFAIGDGVFEVGGAAKSRRQVAKLTKAYVVKDDITLPSAGVIPLYLFGFRQ